MRTTVTLDPDVEALLRAAMKRQGLSFKDALNESVRRGLSGAGHPRRERIALPGIDLQLRAGINLDKALRLADELEDESLIRRMQLGK
jgi:hypothetical protein